MNSSITFLHGHLIGYVLITMIILWSIFIWKEWSTHKKSSFFINICIGLIALSSLACMLLKPAILTEKKSNNIVLLTDQFDEVLVDSIRKRYKKIKSVTYKPNQLWIENKEVYDTIFVVGNGVESYDIWQLDTKNVVFLPSKLPKGIIRYKYNNQCKVGDQLVFRGNYHSPQNGTKLVLEGVGGEPLDSIELTSNKNQSFQLSSRLHVKGKYIYSLIEKDAAGTVITKDPIPVVVDDLVSLKIMILNSAPTFETKYLKNYLAEMGHQLVVKSKITKDKYKFEYFNTKRVPLRAVAQEVLESFDVLIIDNTYLNSLSKTSFLAIKKSIEESGLGVFIQTDQTFFKASNNFGNFSFGVDKQLKTNIIDLPKISISKNKFFFEKDLFLQSIHLNTQKNVVSAYKQYGQGRIAVTTLENSYELQLDGSSDIYKTIWSDIISAISKRSIPPVQWQSNDEVAYIDEPFEFLIRTTINDPLVKNNNGLVPIRRAIDINTVWRGVTYPTQVGWNQISVEKDEEQQVFNFLVTKGTNWKSKAIYEKIKRNKRYLGFSNTEVTKRYRKEPVQQLLFLIVFVLCMGYLWLEPKLK